MSKPYATMSVAERWQWHAETYAFRRIVLGVDEAHSPCDPEGRWFAAPLVDAASAQLAAKRDSARRRRERARSADDEREGRAVANRWAQERGHRDFEDYRLAERIDYSEACKRVAVSILAAAKMPAAPRGELQAGDTARALGVTAKPWQPTPEQLRAGRIELGLEPAADDAAGGAA